MSEWIALGAVVIAALGWWDNRRKILESSIRLEIEPHKEAWNSWYLRNSGTRRVVHPEIDPASVMAFSMSSNVFGLALEPNQAAAFTLHPDKYGRYPDTVLVRFGLRVGGKQQTRIVRFPATKPDGGSSANTEP